MFDCFFNETKNDEVIYGWTMNLKRLKYLKNYPWYQKKFVRLEGGASSDIKHDTSFVGVREGKKIQLVLQIAILQEKYIDLIMLLMSFLSQEALQTKEIGKRNLLI